MSREVMAGLVLGLLRDRGGASRDQERPLRHQLPDEGLLHKDISDKGHCHQEGHLGRRETALFFIKVYKG
jgi:hypothetical protein